VALLGLLPFLIGCPTPCEGVGCLDRHNAAWVGLHSGSALGDAVLEPELSILGDEAQGTDWALLPLDGALVVGVPSTDAIWLLNPLAADSLSLSEAIAVLQGPKEGQGFGAAMDLVPDMNGDGLAELVIGTPSRSHGAASRRDGGASIHLGLGEATGWATPDPAELHLLDSPAWLSILGDDSGSELGSVVAGCADMDGDGLGEIAIAAPQDNSGGALTGSVVLVTSAEAAAAKIDLEAPTLPHRWIGSHVGARAGTSIACRHDLTGDGLADLVMGAPFADEGGEASGALYLIEGGELPAGGPVFVIADRILTLTGDEAWLGQAIATGDLNQDGFPDLVAGAPGAAEGAGAVLIWDGAALRADQALPLAQVDGAVPGDRFGQALALADLTGDGVLDLVVGAPKHRGNDGLAAYDSGALYVFSGGPARDFLSLHSANDATLRLHSSLPYLRTGAAFATADLFGDGRADLLLLHRWDPSQSSAD